MTDLINTYVDEGRFTDLFVEGLGWDRPRGRPRTLAVTTDSGTLTVEEVATYRGITVWECGQIPDGRGQRLVDREARNASDERLVIFHDGQRQEWRWPQAKDTQGTGASRLVLHEHTVGRPNPALAQRLSQIEIGLDEEGVSVVEVGRRLRRAFDAEKVTNRFYKAFKLQHEALCDAITGLEDGGEDAMTSEVRWYASLLLNRIMFIYFMQKKGFLDDDVDYLRNRLIRIRGMQRSGSPESFYDFYKHFLLPLFHHGLGHPERAKAIDDSSIANLIGDIPYVNGGIFSVHPLEEANDIAVPDSSFESLFDFLDGWQWHLDDRLTGDPNEINPDVLGYIFEQFINNKQQGAYYTKEDVTGYMTDNALIPVFLDRICEKTGINPWHNLVRQPSRYIWDSVAYGLETEIPSNIASERGVWPRPSWDMSKPDETIALPGESWWEVVQRREYYADLCKRLAAGEVSSADDAVTANIDLLALAVDTVDAVDSPDDIASLWEILSSLKVIDPTCGSGAFLFAALVTLEALYGAVLDAARLHVQTSPTSDAKRIVDEANGHSSASYYILKHAALNNIYGVDLMPEAVEIARLRLFLKLMSRVSRRDEIEPLPDLEFNIRPGNILVGAVDDESIANAASLETVESVHEVLNHVREAAEVYRTFADAQSSGDVAAVDEHRNELRQIASQGRSRLNQWWFTRNAEAAGSSTIEQYVDAHRPFHWPIEFPEVFSSGGFDVVIGNPPYVNRRNVHYRFSGFVTDGAPDIYAPCIERSIQICKPNARLAMIVMLSLQFSRSFVDLRRVIRTRMVSIHCSSFGLWPNGLFSGVGVRNSILIARRQDCEYSGRVFTTAPVRWPAENRPHIFSLLQYSDATDLIDSVGGDWPRTGDRGVRDFLVAMQGVPGKFGEALVGNDSRVGFKKTSLYFISAFVDNPPAYDDDHSPIEQSQIGDLTVQSGLEEVVIGTLVGKLFCMWWGAKGDLFHVTNTVIEAFPIAPSRLTTGEQEVLAQLGAAVHENLKANATFTRYAGRWLGSYDSRRIHNVTDEFDAQLLRAVGLEEYLEPMARAYWRIQKATGESDNVINVWPPPS